jgi:hypothetical protein
MSPDVDVCALAEIGRKASRHTIPNNKSRGFLIRYPPFSFMLLVQGLDCPCLRETALEQVVIILMLWSLET